MSTPELDPAWVAAAVEGWTTAAMERLPGDQEHMVGAIAAGIPINPEFAWGMIRANFEPLMVAALERAAPLIAARAADLARAQTAADIARAIETEPDLEHSCCDCPGDQKHHAAIARKHAAVAPTA